MEAYFYKRCWKVDDQGQRINVSRETLESKWISPLAFFYVLFYNCFRKGGGPMKKPYVPKRMLTVQLPVELFDKLEKLAKEKGMTKTAVLVEMLTVEGVANAE